MIKSITSLLLLSATFTWAQRSSKVFYTELKEGQEIAANPVKEYQATSTLDKGATLFLYPDITFQTMEGVGGAFNEIGGEALMALPKKDRKEVIKNLFGKDQAAFSYCRTAVGASDFGIDAYSYSEVKGDYNMESFSIEREKTSVIPYLQMAFKRNKDLKLFASPWSPPGWMKESGYMDKGDENRETHKLINDPKIYKAYALYFSKYIEAYQKEGIEIERLIVQNEQDAVTKYPSNYMSPSEMGTFIANYLRPQFTKDEIDTEIWAGTFRTLKSPKDLLEYAQNKEWTAAADGIGIQYTSDNHISNVKALFPEVKLFHTEGNCHGGANSIEQAYKRYDEVSQYINFGFPNFCYWNMILNETKKSGWDWSQNSLINIDRAKKTVTYNPDYAAIYLFSKFIQPGVKRIASSYLFNPSRNVMSFKDSEGTLWVLLKNEGDKAAAYNLKVNNSEDNFVEIPANSLAVVALGAN